MHRMNNSNTKVIQHLKFKDKNDEMKISVGENYGVQYM